MARYTAKMLENAIDGMNERLEREGAKFRFVVGYRNGYTAIDSARPEDIARYCVYSNLFGGSPKECHEKALIYFWQWLYEASVENRGAE